MASRCPAGHEFGPGQGRRGCRRCRRDRVVDLAVAADRSLPRLVIEAAVDAAAPAGHVLWHLEQALAGDPAALVLGAPPAAGALAAELAARGSALAVPACAACGRTGKPLFRGERGGVCQRCRAWQTAEPCAACGKAKPVAVRTAAGEPLCEMCRRRSGRAHRECGTCGKTATIAVRGRDGQPDICVNCYRMPEATCAGCGQPPAVQLRRDCPAGLPVMLAEGNRRMCALRPGPPAPGPLAGRAGLRPVLHHRAAAAADSARPAARRGGWLPRPARMLTPAPAAPGFRSPTRALTAG